MKDGSMNANPHPIVLDDAAAQVSHNAKPRGRGIVRYALATLIVVGAGLA